jgi:hypothetical protein
LVHVGDAVDGVGPQTGLTERGLGGRKDREWGQAAGSGGQDGRRSMASSDEESGGSGRERGAEEIIRGLKRREELRKVRELFAGSEEDFAACSRARAGGRARAGDGRRSGEGGADSTGQGSQGCVITTQGLERLLRPSERGACSESLAAGPGKRGGGVAQLAGRDGLLCLYAALAARARHEALTPNTNIVVDWIRLDRVRLGYKDVSDIQRRRRLAGKKVNREDHEGTRMAGGQRAEG